ncbi:MAG: hypothetical protein SFZ02_12345 [bacterium]|nr:hypothetical protein [bacterium]
MAILEEEIVKTPRKRKPKYQFKVGDRVRRIGFPAVYTIERWGGDTNDPFSGEQGVGIMDGTRQQRVLFGEHIEHAD